jgi:hypothetical protein
LGIAKKPRKFSIPAEEIKVRISQNMGFLTGFGVGDANHGLDSGFETGAASTPF